MTTKAEVLAGGYHCLHVAEPRQRTNCSWCGKRRLCYSGEWSQEFPPTETYPVWCCATCLTPNQRLRILRAPIREYRQKVAS